MPRERALSTEQLPVPIEMIERRIFLIRGQRVMLDADLAELYQVPTKRLNEAIRRNRSRFPDDFMFRLTNEEASVLRSQFATLETGRGRYSKYAPYAFTEHGVAMLSSVLRSERAVQVNILIVRAFVRLREILATHKDLARKIEDLEKTQKEHGIKIDTVFAAIKKLLQPPKEVPRRPIGFGK